MSSLYFLGIKKSTIKKRQPFKYLFDLRDKRNYQKILAPLQSKIEDISSVEAIIEHSLNEKTLKLLFRKFPCSDLNVFNQVFILQSYKWIIQQMLLFYSANATVKIIDAGANVGYSAIYFQAFFNQAEIVTIEPEKGNSLQLEKNFSINNFHLKRMVKGALWNKQTLLEVTRDFRDNREAAFTVQETNSPYGIPGYSFNEILENENWKEADLLKLDIEGGERFLFDTVEKANQILQKIKFLAIEIHDEFNIRETIYAHLQRNGFDYVEFDDLTLAINKNKTGIKKPFES
jgi:FkbM family methyltransferase